MSAEIVLRFVAFGIVVCFCVNLARGQRQRIEGGGTLFRYLWVCAVLAVIESLPLFAWLVLASQEWAGEDTGILAWAATAFACFYGARILGPPLRLHGRQGTLPLADAPGLVDRVGAVANRLKIPTPRVRLLATFAGAPLMLAWAGGLAAPSIGITGGLLTRLPAAEADAIIAHELAHIATGSLWFYPLVPAIAGVASVFSSHSMPALLSAAWGLALFTGLLRIMSRRVEIQCDRHAARTVGHGAAYSGLGKVHVAHPLAHSGWLALVVHAVSTHPSQALRLNSIWRDAAPEVQASLASHASEARRDRISAIFACAIWLVAILLPWTRYTNQFNQTALAAVFLLIAMAPLFLMIGALWRQIRLVRRRRQVRTAASRLARLATLVIALGLPIVLLTNAEDGLLATMGLLLVMLGGIAFLIAAVLDFGDSRLRRTVQNAISKGDFVQARALARQRRRPTRDPLVRQLAAVAAAVLDDCETARAELAQLVEEGRGPAGVVVSIGMLTLSSDPARAFEYFQAAKKNLPGDTGAICFAGWALGRLGRFDEAEAEIHEAIRISPREGWHYAILAEVALRRGELARIEELLAKASEFDPGGAHALLVEARLRLARGENADATIDAAVQAAAGNPFALLQGEIKELRRHLAPVLATVVTEEAPDNSPTMTS